MGQPGAFPRPAQPVRTPLRHTARGRLVLRTAALVASLATALGGALAITPTAYAADPNPATPGDFTGLGFDQCLAPTAASMDTWWKESPYAAVGIYTSGDSRACRDQPNLTGWWVQKQIAAGWKLLPITLGPQASCTTRERYLQQVRINPSTSGDYSRARSQGQAEATKAVAAAKRIGINPGSALWYDIEAFSISNTACRESALAFLSSWTLEVRAQKYISGVYSSAASGIKMLADARTNKRFTMPDYLWIADWNGVADTRTSYISDTLWANHQRVHQYRGGHDETYGGVRINIDNNFLDLGKGSVAGSRAAHCSGVNISYVSYPTLKPGTTNASMVKALQCLLQERGYYKGALSGTYDAATTKAAAAFQTDRKLPVSTTWSRNAWMAMLSVGGSPVIKMGSTGEEVRRVQRALNASGLGKLAVSGVANKATMNAVVAYRKRMGYSAVMVGNSSFWGALKRGAY